MILKTVQRERVAVEMFVYVTKAFAHVSHSILHRVVKTHRTNTLHILWGSDIWEREPSPFSAESATSICCPYCR